VLDIFAEYATNDSLENDGTWMEVGDAKFLIARTGNKKYIRKLSRAVERHKKQLDRKDDAADKLSDDIMIGVIAETVLLGWEGVGYQGEALPYSVENAKMLLGIKDFRRQIMELADDFDAFKAVEEEETGED
jgi:hypothetical protein